MVSIVHAARDIGRLRDISRVLARHGFGEIAQRLGLVRRGGQTSAAPPSVSASRAERIRHVLEDLGPSFVKLGQIASTRADLLPPDVITELRRLQDGVPAVPFTAIRERVELSLGAPLEELFESWDETPLAAASIAQVHRAVLRTGTGAKEVVLKVQRPGIAETISSDLDILHNLAALLERTVAETRIYSPTGLVQQFDRAVTNELDFTTEAENARRFARNFEHVPGVRFPNVYRERSSKHVICLEYLDGQKIDEAVRNGHSGPVLARRAVEIIVKQIFEDGFFHADPHPGNVLILGPPQNAVYALIDLGMVGRLSPRMRDLTIDMMVAAFRSDYDAIADALYAIASPTEKIDLRAFRSEVALLADRYLGKRLKELELSSLVRDLVGAANRYGLEVPSDFLLVGKTLMTVEGIGKEIAPELDIMEETRPFFLDLVRRRYSPERLGLDMLRQLDRLTSMSKSVPEQLQEVLEDVRTGRLTIRASQPDLVGAAALLARKLFTGLIFLALALAAALLAGSGKERAAWFVGSGALLWLSVHLLRDATRRRP